MGTGPLRSTVQSAALTLMFPAKPHNRELEKIYASNVQTYENITYLQTDATWLGREPHRDKVFKVNILYCHGNGQDAFIAIHKFDSLLQETFKKFDMAMIPFSVKFKMTFWEYPTYSISKQTDLSKQAMFNNARMIWNKVQQLPNEQNLNICIGCSIGTAFACHLSFKAAMDILILRAPFAQLPRDYSTIAETFVGSLYDNIEELRKKNEGLKVYAIMSEADNLIKFDKAKDILQYVTECVIIKADTMHTHQDFFELSGFKRFGKTLGSILLRNEKFVNMIDKCNKEDEVRLNTETTRKDSEEQEECILSQQIEETTL